MSTEQIKIPEHITREIDRKHKKREQLFGEDISCPDCDSRDFQVFPWCYCYAGSLRQVSCRGCGNFFNVYWDSEQEGVRVVDSGFAAAMVA